MPMRTFNGKQLPYGSHVIALNTNTAAEWNFYTFGQLTDPGNQASWLESELSRIEELGGIAIIIGHYNPKQYLH